MTLPIQYITSFWLWWSNPISKMHESHKYHLALDVSELSNLDYESLVEIRNNLKLSEFPDDSLLHRYHLFSVGMVSQEDLLNYLLPFSYLTFSDSIINARQVDWTELYGVTDSDLIRKIILERGSLPNILNRWVFTSSTIFELNVKQPLMIEDRIRVGVTIFLDYIAPKFSKRWKLMLPKSIQTIINELPPLGQEEIDALEDWSKPLFIELHRKIAAEYEVIDFTSSLSDDGENWSELLLSEDIDQ